MRGEEEEVLDPNSAATAVNGDGFPDAGFRRRVAFLSEERGCRWLWLGSGKRSVNSEIGVGGLLNVDQWTLL